MGNAEWYEPFRRLIFSILKLENPHISGIFLLSAQRFREREIEKAYGDRMSFGRNSGVPNASQGLFQARKRIRLSKMS